MRRAVFLVGGWIAASGCTVVAEPEAGWIAKGESIAVVQTREWLFDWESTRQVFLRPGKRELRIDLEPCLIDALSAVLPGMPVLDSERFAVALFPDLPARQAPTSPESIRLLLDHPAVQPRVAALNLRYLVYAGGRSEIRDLTEFLECASGYGGAGCFGFGEWTASASASLLVLDLKRAREMRAAAGEKTARGAYVHLLPFIGLAYLPRPEYDLCPALAGELVKLLRGSPQ